MSVRNEPLDPPPWRTSREDETHGIVFRGSSRDDTFQIFDDHVRLNGKNFFFEDYDLNPLDYDQWTIEGKSGDDTIDLRLNQENISVLVRGQDGNDYIHTANASLQALEIRGGDGKDYLVGSQGNDKISGGEGKDTIEGQDGNDRIQGGSQNDRIYGQKGNDRIEGNAGNDQIDGGRGNDLMRGNTGRDHFYGGSGVNHVLGGTTVPGMGLDRTHYVSHLTPPEQPDLPEPDDEPQE